MATVPRPIVTSLPASADDERFEALVRRQSRFVFQVAYAVTRNAADAEEVVQETFFKLYRTGSWERIANERAFLARTAWRIAVDRRPRAGSGASAHWTSPGADPEEAAIAEDRTGLVHRMIDALPEHLRQPLALSAIEEMTSQEIAEAMGIAEGTVRTRLMRARQMLRQKLQAILGDAV